MKEIDQTLNTSVYKKLRRKAIAKMKRGCGFCPPHKGENKKFKKIRSWKMRTKKEKQYKII